MARFTLENDQREGTDSDVNNPSVTARQLHESEQQAAYDRDFDSITNHPDNDDVRQSARNIEKREQEPNASWKTNVTGSTTANLSSIGKISRLAKRKGPIGAIAGLIIAAIIAIGMMPFNMVTHLMQNMTSFNDSSSVAMERRFIKVFHNLNNGTDPSCTSTKIKCKMGRISNSALRKLEKKGVRACFDGNCDKATTKRSGYPAKNPSHYEFDIDGKKQRVAVKDLNEFLTQKENRKFAAKLYGVKGVFNMRIKAWAGKHITSKLYNRFGLKRDGGLADGKNSDVKSSEERRKSTYEKLKKRIPTIESLESRAGSAKDLAEKKLKHAKKGGVVYLSAVAACIAPQVPRIVATGVAAVQLAQIMPVAMDLVLSPGAKLQASGLDEAYKVSPGDSEAVGMVLTEQTPRKSDGKLTSAVDSPYLLAAAGLNTAKPAISKDFTPGYSVFSNKGVQVAGKIEGLSKSQCDIVLHPATMYTAMAADAVGTVIAAGTIVGGIIKVAASVAITQAISMLIGATVSGAVKAVIMDLAENDKVPEARGEELGDIIGIGSAAFFSAGGMAHHLPTLKNSQLAAYESVRQESEVVWRDMAVASLSPFDTSSRYTFLGSLLFNFHTTINNQSSMIGKLLALLPSPALVLAPQASANQTYTQTYCSYGSDFSTWDAYGESTDKSQLAGRNMAGLPCTGILPSQASIPTETALDLMIGEGWVKNDDGAKIPEGATIADLVSSGVIAKDTPLYDFIDQCSDASTGAYLFNADSCTVLSVSGNPNEMGGCQTNDDGEEVCPDEEEVKIDGIDDRRSPVAITPFLIDFQITQAINGEDGS